MGRVKSDHRNRLSERTLELLMRITMEGSDLEHYNPKAATDLFFTTIRHPNVQQYGERPDAHSTSAAKRQHIAHD